MKLFVYVTLLAGAGASVHACTAADAADYLTPSFHERDQYANVFSRTIAFDAKGFQGTVQRVSGTATYRVTDGAAARPQLHIDYHYDGRPPGNGLVELRDGGATNCFDGKCAPNSDASGLAYNPLLWGTPPATLQVGQHWTVDIATPWELGTPGRQTVTVLALDPTNHQATLQREGSGDGAYLGDPPTTMLQRDGQAYPASVQPGHSHWIGITTFQAGIVVSDELVVERPVTLVSDKLGRIEAHQREYILLNAMPVAQEPATDAVGAHPPSA